MQKRLCADRPWDWDRYLAPLLFAYSETPQASLGFSPLELIYGRSVRGPMAILKELWTGEVENPEIKTTYQYILELRERLESTCKLARQELSKASETAKNYYNRKTRPRTFKAGDYVLILLPTDRNKLLLQWKGPFRVLEKVGNVDYRLDLNGKPKMFHANLLKKYIVRPGNQKTEEPAKAETIGNSLECASVSIIECEDPLSEFELGSDEFMTDNEDVIALPPLKPQEAVADVKISSNLDPEQRSQVKRILGNHRDVLTDLPGKTNLGQHEITLSTPDPIRSKPYPLPFALRETVNAEVEDMIKMRIIEPSNSPYASPIVLVKKKDGTNRFCIDFRKLNKVTVFDAEPLPSQDEIFAKLSQDNYFFSQIGFIEGILANSTK